MIVRGETEVEKLAVETESVKRLGFGDSTDGCGEKEKRWNFCQTGGENTERVKWGGEVGVECDNSGS